MTRKALCVGCNYPSKAFGLAGAVNDAFLIADCLQKNFGYDPENVCVLHDLHPGQKKSIKVDPAKKPTRQNILARLQWLVRGARPGDVLFFSFSGYGLQVDDMDGYQDEGLDEAILPTDFVDGRDGDYTVIVTDDIHDILMGIPPNCQVTVLMDCDHATSVIDVSGTLDGGLVNGLKYQTYCGLKVHTTKVQLAMHNREVWQEERARAVKARPRFQPMMEIDNPRKGRLPTRPAMSRSSPVAFCYSAAAHGQTSMEMQMNRVVDGKDTPKQHGVLTWCFVQALEELRYDCTHTEMLWAIRKHMAALKEKDLPRLDQEVLLTFSTPLSNPQTMKVLQQLPIMAGAGNSPWSIGLAGRENMTKTSHGKPYPGVGAGASTSQNGGGKGGMAMGGIVPPPPPGYIASGAGGGTGETGTSGGAGGPPPSSAGGPPPGGHGEAPGGYGGPPHGNAGRPGSRVPPRCDSAGPTTGESPYGAGSRDPYGGVVGSPYGDDGTSPRHHAVGTHGQYGPGPQGSAGGPPGGGGQVWQTESNQSWSANQAPPSPNASQRVAADEPPPPPPPPPPRPAQQQQQQQLQQQQQQQRQQQHNQYALPPNSNDHSSWNGRDAGFQNPVQAPRDVSVGSTSAPGGSFNGSSQPEVPYFPGGSQAAPGAYPAAAAGPGIGDSTGSTAEVALIPNFFNLGGAMPQQGVQQGAPVRGGLTPPNLLGGNSFAGATSFAAQQPSRGLSQQGMSFAGAAGLSATMPPGGPGRAGAMGAVPVGRGQSFQGYPQQAPARY